MAENVPLTGADLSEEEGGRMVAYMAALIIPLTIAVIARLTPGWWLTPGSR